MSDIEVTKLANGITVASHHMPHLESIALGLWVGAGARSETPKEHGISHLLEHMAFKGTTRRSARDIAEAVEAVGGEMNAETSVDHTTYYLRLLKDDLALGLDVLGDIVCDPLLDPEELSLEQHVILQEIGAAHDVPEDWVFELFQQAAFPGQAIGRTVLGTPDSIRAHTLGRYQALPRRPICRAADRDRGGRARRPFGGWCGSPNSISAGCPATSRAEPEPGMLQGRRVDGNSPGEGGADPARLCRAPLHRPPVHGHASLLGDPRRRHGVAALPGAARRTRPLLLGLFVLLAVRRYRAARSSGGNVGGRYRRAGAARLRRASQDDRRRHRGRAQARQGAASRRAPDGAREPDCAGRPDGAAYPRARPAADARGDGGERRGGHHRRSCRGRREHARRTADARGDRTGAKASDPSPS